MKPPGSGDPVIDGVLATAHRLREQANAELAACGLSLWTFKALRALDLLGPSRSIDLSEFLAISPRTVTGAVDALELEGLVERRPHPSDRRARLVVLTDAGEQRLVEAQRVHRDLVQRVGGALSEQQREQFLELIAHLSTALTVQPAEHHA